VGEDDADAGPALQAVAAPAPETPLITLEDARARIGTEVLTILDQKFKGNLTEVRHPDERDHFF
jgi:hypothetical protein